MFEINLERNRLLATCIVFQYQKPSIFPLIFDTGAIYTVIRAKNLGRNLKESDFQHFETKTLSGVVSGGYFNVYKLSVTQFNIGGINLGQQDIWVSFNDLSDDVLGLDLLGTIAFMYNNMDNRLTIFNNYYELKNFILQEDIKDTASAFRSKYNIES